MLDASRRNGHERAIPAAGVRQRVSTWTEVNRAFALRTIMLCWLAIWLSAILTAEYYVRVEAPAMQARVTLHEQMVTGTAPYQYRYRILTPYVADGFARLLQGLPILKSSPAAPPLPYSRQAFVLAYCVLNMAGLVVLLWAVGELVSRLHGFELALFGVALSAMLIGFTFRDHYFQPWSFWEGAFFALGLLLIHRKQYWLFTGLALLALVNRETSLFLLIAFFFTALPARMSIKSVMAATRARDLRFAVANLCAWVLGFFALHRAVGYKPSTFFLETAVNGNRAHFGYAAILNVLFIGLIIPLVLWGLRLSSPLIRRSAMMLPAYFGLLGVIGYWWEIRYWITVIPIVVPGLIAALASTGDQTLADQESPRIGIHPLTAQAPAHWSGQDEKRERSGGQRSLVTVQGVADFDSSDATT